MLVGGYSFSFYWAPVAARGRGEMEEQHVRRMPAIRRMPSGGYGPPPTLDELFVRYLHQWLGSLAWQGAAGCRGVALLPTPACVRPDPCLSTHQRVKDRRPEGVSSHTCHLQVNLLRFLLSHRKLSAPFSSVFHSGMHLREDSRSSSLGFLSLGFHEARRAVGVTRERG